jgi:hypothetical protein
MAEQGKCIPCGVRYEFVTEDPDSGIVAVTSEGKIGVRVTSRVLKHCRCPKCNGELSQTVYNIRSIPSYYYNPWSQKVYAPKDDWRTNMFAKESEYDAPKNGVHILL